MNETIDIRRLRLFHELATEGAETVAGHVNMMTELDMETRITRINFVEPGDVGPQIGSMVGAGVRLTDTPHGYVLILFEADDAKQIAQMMLSSMGVSGSENGFSDMEKSAMREIGNITTSGFIDGWANVLQTTIDISTPRFLNAPGSDTMTELAGDDSDSLSLVFESRIQDTESGVELRVYSFPQLDDLVELTNGVTVNQ